MKLKRIQQLILLGIVLVIVGAAVLLLSEIGEKDEQPEQEVTFTSTTTSALKQYKPNSLNGYISNPGIGWQYMDGSDKSIMPETVAYPNRSEISWKILNPGNGVTNFSKLDNKINSAKSSGKQISFRVYTQRGEGYGGHQMPAWVVNLGVPLVTGDGESQPDYSNCIYQNQWGRFVNALRQRYDGNTDIAYIDVSGYGNFNEWGWVDGITEWEDSINNPSTLDGYARNRLADIFIGGSNNNHKCRRNNGTTKTVSYSYPGFQKTQLVMPWAGIRQSVKYVYDARSDVGFRHDCVGRTDVSAETKPEIRDAFGKRWKTAPIVYELCGINWNNSGFQSRLNNSLKFSHASLVHDNPNNTAEPKSVMKGIMKKVGYRFKVVSGSYSDRVAQGGKLSVSMNWQNVGYGRSYPSMGQNLVAKTMLVDGSNIIVAQSVLDNRVDRWMPADPIGSKAPIKSTSANIQVPKNTKPGTYYLKVAVFENRTGKTIKLAIEGGNNKNYYQVGSVTVTSGGVSPTPTPSPTTTYVVVSQVPSPTDSTNTSTSPNPSTTATPGTSVTPETTGVDGSLSTTIPSYPESYPPDSFPSGSDQETGGEAGDLESAIKGLINTLKEQLRVTSDQLVLISGALCILLLLILLVVVEIVKRKLRKKPSNFFQ